LRDLPVVALHPSSARPREPRDYGQIAQPWLLPDTTAAFSCVGSVEARSVWRAAAWRRSGIDLMICQTWTTRSGVRAAALHTLRETNLLIHLKTAVI
jgi:hypothetical protein